MAVTLGKRYRDTFLGFEGIAYSRHEYRTGCTRVTLQKLSEDGGAIKMETFDEPELEEVRTAQPAAPPPKQESDRGGPHDMPAARPAPER